MSGRERNHFVVYKARVLSSLDYVDLPDVFLALWKNHPHSAVFLYAALQGFQPLECLQILGAKEDMIASFCKPAGGDVCCPGLQLAEEILIVDSEDRDL